MLFVIVVLFVINLDKNIINNNMMFILCVLFFFIIQAEAEGEVPEYFAMIDTDVVLAYPVTCRDLFDPETGRPWAYYWPHIVYGNLASTERLFNGSSDARRIGSFMTYFPQVFYILQRGVQWKQGVVICMVYYFII